MGPYDVREPRARANRAGCVSRRARICLPSHEPTLLGSLQWAFSGELSAGEVPLAELAVEQLHDEAVAMREQCRVVARPLVAQEGMPRVELVPLIEDAGLFEAATD